MALKEISPKEDVKDNPYYFNKSYLNSMTPLKCHGYDCVPNVFHLLRIIDKKMATFLASLYKKGIEDDKIIEYLNSIHDAQYVIINLYTIPNGKTRHFTLHESIIKLKEMEEYVKSTLRINSALIGGIEYKKAANGHVTVIANIDGDVYIIDPQQNKYFNISKIIRENKYEKPLLDYIKNIVRLTVYSMMTGSKRTIYKNPFSEIFIKKSLLRKQNRSPPKYINVDNLIPNTKYRIINKSDGIIEVGEFYEIYRGDAIFLIDKEREEIDPDDYLFLDFDVRSAPNTRSKSKKSKSKTMRSAPI